MTNKTSWLSYPAEDKTALQKMEWRIMLGSGAFSFGRMQAESMLYSMIPVINHYYSDEKDRIEGYNRHFVLWNTTPQVGGFGSGLASAMEKKAAQDPTFDKSAINAVKGAIMGPLAGVGDSIFWGSLKVLCIGIGCSFGVDGSILGPIMYFIVYNVPSTIIRHLCPRLAFNIGETFLTNASATGLIQQFTEYASIVGLTTVGGMTVGMVSVSIELSYVSSNGVSFKVQDLIDAIAPGVMPVVLTLICMKLLRSGKMNVTTEVLGLLVVFIIGHLLTIF